MTKNIFFLIEHLQGQVMDITYMLAAAARAVAADDGKVTAILLGENAQDLGSDVDADEILYTDHEALKTFTSDAYQLVLSNIIKDRQPTLVLMGDTTVGADVAGGISVALDLPLVSGCFKLLPKDGKLLYVSHIYGGKIMAEGELPEPTSIVTMVPGGYRPEDGQTSSPAKTVKIEAPDLEGLRVSLVQYVEPEVGDVDIAKEALLVAVGRGIQREDNLELANELADALGGVVCASRPVVDQGWIPTSRMVGKSGKSVTPSIYLALGISGAPEHVEGMSESELILAVNTDPTAPIFDIAQFGAEVDMLDFMSALTAKIQEEKGG